MPFPVAAETRASVSVSTGATTASNPFLLDARNTEAIGASLDVDPSVFFTDENSEVTLAGKFNLEKFSGYPGTDGSANVQALGVFRLDERTIFRTGVGFLTSESAARRFFRGVNLEDLKAGEFPTGPMVDPTLGNVVGRTNRLEVNAEVEHLLDPKSTLTLRTGLGLTKVDEDSAREYKRLSLRGDL